MERFRTTLILLGVLVVLIILALFLQNANLSTPASPTPVPQAYVWQSSNPVIAMQVVSGSKTVSVTKNVTTTVWSLEEPVKMDADPNVGGLAAGFQNLLASNVVTQSSTLADFGLEKQTLSVTVTFSDTKHSTKTLLVGKTTFDGSKYYVKPAGQSTVYTVANDTIEPIRSWLTTPPKAPPTATPIPTAIPPTATPTGTRTVLPAATATATP